MRAGPLSDERVISILNGCFVPVYISNEAYAQKEAPKEGDAQAAARGEGAAGGEASEGEPSRRGGSNRRSPMEAHVSPEEEAERDRIYREALGAGLPAGSVHVYILAPDDGHVLDSLHVAQAAKTNVLLSLLERITLRLGTTAGEPAVAPSPQSSPPEAAPGALIVHVTGRGYGGASWDDFPSEDWVVLDRSAWSRLLPPEGLSERASWDLDPDVSARLLVHFYPQTENNDTSPNRIEQQRLRASIFSVKDGVARALLEGRLRMRHDFYPGREDGRRVDAMLEGVMDIDLTRRRITGLTLVTAGATYGPGTIAVAARLAPRPEARAGAKSPAPHDD